MDPEELIAMAAQIGARIEHVGDHAVITTRDGQRLTVAYPPETTYPYGPTASERRDGERAESVARDAAHIAATAPPPTPGRYGSTMLTALGHARLRGYVPRASAAAPPMTARAGDYSGPSPRVHGTGDTAVDPVASRRAVMAPAPAPAAPPPAPPPAAAPRSAPSREEIMAAARVRRSGR